MSQKPHWDMVGQHRPCMNASWRVHFDAFGWSFSVMFVAFESKCYLFSSRWSNISYRYGMWWLSELQSEHLAWLFDLGSSPVLQNSPNPHVGGRFQFGFCMFQAVISSQTRSLHVVVYPWYFAFTWDCLWIEIEGHEHDPKKPFEVIWCKPSIR